MENTRNNYVDLSSFRDKITNNERIEKGYLQIVSQFSCFRNLHYSSKYSRYIYFYLWLKIKQINQWNGKFTFVRGREIMKVQFVYIAEKRTLSALFVYIGNITDSVSM